MHRKIIMGWSVAMIITFFLWIECVRSGIEWTPVVWKEYLKSGPVSRNLPDFSHAGYLMGDQPIPDMKTPVFDVTESRFGAIPDDGLEDTAAIQAAVRAAGVAGGGVVYLPKGRYDIHKTPDSPFLQITHDHVILRGQGSDESGTILFMGAPGRAERVRRLGSVPAEKEARHYTAVAVMGKEDVRELAVFTRSVARGQTDVMISDTSVLSQGQTVVMECIDPLIDPKKPFPEKTDIPAQLIFPFQLVQAQTDSYGDTSRKHSWICGIEKILDRQTIRLTRPMRFDQFIRYTPRIYSFNGLTGVGIEHLRIESAWPGNYRHHKPCEGADGSIMRTATEQDYLWGGIWISSAVNGWVRDVVFKNMTQGVILSHSAQWTIQDIGFYGHDGHAGVTIGWSNDNLVERVDFHARMVHPVTVKMMAAGNVFTDCKTHYEGRDLITATDTAMDFHGIFPYENLFEKMNGFYICPGGDVSVLPHAGVRNVFWNIEAPSRIEGYGAYGGDSFVQTYDYGSTSSKTPETMYEHFPQAFYIGIVRKGNRMVTIGNSMENRRNEWMTVEGLNCPGIAIPSLYEAQREIIIRPISSN
ncbi:MAG: virulence factor [Desulfobacterium sp.]|nr:virulence factor [Desulfobacterium sp.]